MRLIGTDTNQTTCLRAIALIVTPEWETNEQSPSDGNSYTFSRGCVAVETLSDIADIWSDILDSLSRISVEDWPLVISAADEWFYPGRVGGMLSDEQLTIFEQTAKTILTSLARIAADKPGVLSALLERGRHLSIHLDVVIDADFARLFPDDPVDDERGWKIRGEEQAEAARQLAAEWLLKSPFDAVGKLVWCIKEAESKGHAWPDFTGYVSQLIAEQTSAPNDWLESLVSAGAPPAVVHPFLERIASRREHRWLESVALCLHRPDLSSAGLAVAVTSSESHDESLEIEILEAARKLPTVVENRCWDARIPIFRLKRFLLDTDRQLASATATGMWHAHTQGHEIPAELLEPWRQAVIMGNVKEHYVCAICKSDTLFAHRWLCDRAKRTSESYLREGNAITAAASVLSTEKRHSVLKVVEPRNYAARDIVAAIVGNDGGLYQSLLQIAELESLHLVPLRDKPDEQWAKLALVALEHGYLPNEIASAAFKNVGMRRGRFHEHCEEDAGKWAELLLHPDERIHHIAEIGRQSALHDAVVWRERASKEDFFETYG